LKIRANNNAVLQVFLEYYSPLWQRAGFSWELFPDLVVYININPIRFIAEELGYEVKYDKKTQKVTIRG
jgi:hypothetical protein